MSVRSILIYPANLAIFEQNRIFGRPKGLSWTSVEPKRDVMGYEILRPSFSLAHCAPFMSRWPLLRGGGLHNHSCDRAEKSTSVKSTEIRLYLPFSD